ncbi:hypothetical protein BAE44_0003732 [Dichanthelium oligosanthes]|uniref:Dirigent protein n=1 Tax=Dichanthelium oligosanthes TaxID=888268 RepID=A0A1E5WCT7_9POAL|nr:hypothetical protein BAE44_0003732 [Dichanthelium oligosanthes]
MEPVRRTAVLGGARAATCEVATETVWRATPPDAFKVVAEVAPARRASLNVGGYLLPEPPEEGEVSLHRKALGRPEAAPKETGEDWVGWASSDVEEVAVGLGIVTDVGLVVVVAAGHGDSVGVGLEEGETSEAMSNDDLANFEVTAMATPVVYRGFTFRDLYMRRTKGKKKRGANQAVLRDSDGVPIGTHDGTDMGAMAVHNWEVYDGPGPDAKLVARARGLHIDTSGEGFFYNTFSFVFEHGRLKGSTLQAMGVAPKWDDEYSIVGGSGVFAMANGVVTRSAHKRDANTEIDRLTIKGLIPILNETIQLAPLEFIKEVSGTTGVFGGHTVVTSMTLVTNLQTYGPFGQPNGTSFSVPVPGGSSIVGFFGRAGRYVDAVGVYVHAHHMN